MMDPIHLFSVGFTMNKLLKIFVIFVYFVDQMVFIRLIAIV